ncbi:MAG TPA: hypothetical protein DCQ50_06860 [Chryseobacterium sp.]|nr:hypothetical protein [Chryseobacterium sp.]
MKKEILCALVVLLLSCSRNGPLPAANFPKDLHVANLEILASDIPPAPYNGLFFTDKNTGFAIARNGKLVKTMDGGLKWSSIVLPVNCFLKDIQFTDNNNGYIVGHDESGVRFFSTRDGGMSWNVIKLGKPNTSSTGMFFLNRNRGFITGINLFVQTSDGGASWSEVLQDNIFGFNDVNFRNHRDGYATSTDGVYYVTYNGGDTWEQKVAGTKEDIRDIYFSQSLHYAVIGNNYLLDLKSRSIVDSMPKPIQKALFLSNDKCIGVGQHFGEGFWPIGDIFLTNDRWKTYEQKKYNVSEAIEVNAITRIDDNKTLMIGNAPEKSMLIMLRY